MNIEGYKVMIWCATAGKQWPSTVILCQRLAGQKTNVQSQHRFAGHKSSDLATAMLQAKDQNNALLIACTQETAVFETIAEDNSCSGPGHPKYP